MNYRQIIYTAIILLLFTVIGTSLVALTYDNTRERIAVRPQPEKTKPSRSTAHAGAMQRSPW